MKTIDLKEFRKFKISLKKKIIGSLLLCNYNHIDIEILDIIR